MDPCQTIAASAVRHVTWSGAIATAMFLALVWLTTQVDALRAVVPFTEDPYDAIVSFAVIGLAVVGGASIVRIVGASGRAYDPVVARRIAIGAAIATIVVAVAIVSDITALMAVGVASLDPPTLAALTFLAITTLVTAHAVARVWMARRELIHPAPASVVEPDLIDDLGTIAGLVGAPRFAARFVDWAERSTLSPRRHRLLTGLLGAVTAGAGAIVWHAFREGAWASPAAALVFGGLMAIGVGGAYLLCLEPLRLLRPIRERPTGTG